MSIICDRCRSTITNEDEDMPRPLMFDNLPIHIKDKRREEGEHFCRSCFVVVYDAVNAAYEKSRVMDQHRIECNYHSLKIGEGGCICAKK